MADDLLIQKIENGTFTENTAKTSTSTETETTGTTNLGKDAFLQLLVAEMQNQDPLEPSTNTEWISQLATFSQLEELQSLTSTTENSQVFSLVGKQVIVTSESTSGQTIKKSGLVDYATYSGGEAKLSVDGSLYSIDNLYSVIDSDYYYEQNAPYVVNENAEYTFNGDEPNDITFEVNLGSDIATAKNVNLLIGNTVLSSDYVTTYGSTVSISADLLQELSVGKYTFDVVFDDKNYTTVNDAFSINVYNSHPTVTDNSETDSVTETDKETGTEKVNSDDGTDSLDSIETKTESDENIEDVTDNNTSTETKTITIENEDLIGSLIGFDYDEIRALYPELTDEEFEDQYGYMFMERSEFGLE